MKTIILAVMMVFLVQSVAYADEKKGKGEKFEKLKERVVGNIYKRRVFLDDLESCVKSSKSRSEMKSCRNEHKQKIEALRAERKEMKEKRKERREKRRSED